MKRIIITLIILTTTLFADPAFYVRDPKRLSATAHGYASANDKKVPVLIVTYGSDSIAEAQSFGRLQAVTNHPFLFAAQAIKDRAAERYPGQTEMQRWFIADCAKAYDQEKAGMK